MIEIGVALERNGDQIANGILQFVAISIALSEFSSSSAGPAVDWAHAGCSSTGRTMQNIASVASRLEPGGFLWIGADKGE
jgi:hypothetical protein